MDTCYRNTLVRRGMDGEGALAAPVDRLAYRLSPTTAAEQVHGPEPGECHELA